MSRRSRSVEKESFWRLVLDEYGKSGLTASAFCDREGISKASFYAWRGEIKRRDGNGSPTRIVDSGKLLPVDIVDVTSHPISDRQLEITTPGGFTLRCHPGFGELEVQAILTAIVNCERRNASC